MGELIILHPSRTDHPQANAYGFPPVQDVPEPVRHPSSSAPEWTPPLVDVTCGGAFGLYAVKVGVTRVKIFNSATNASRFASELRVMLKGGEL